VFELTDRVCMELRNNYDVHLAASGQVVNVFR
jgi:hypothetical protein